MNRIAVGRIRQPSGLNDLLGTTNIPTGASGHGMGSYGAIPCVSSSLTLLPGRSLQKNACLTSLVEERGDRGSPKRKLEWVNGSSPNMIDAGGFMTRADTKEGLPGVLPRAPLVPVRVGDVSNARRHIQGHLKLGCERYLPKAHRVRVPTRSRRTGC